MSDRLTLILCLLIIFQACTSIHGGDGGPISGAIDVSLIPNAVPRSEPKSKYGNPESYVVLGKIYHVMNNSKGFVQRGIASWYGTKFHGRKTSSGEVYDMYAMTAAHKNLPLPSYVEVRNLKNGRSVVVRVNDRGPFHENRIIDLSYTAAKKIGIVKSGTGLVEVRSLEPETYNGKTEAIQVQTTDKGAFGFYIQVGAFSNLVNAEKLKSKLAIAWNSVKINKALTEGGQIYRVWIGPLQDVELADRIVASLGKFGVEEHRIVFD